MKKLPLLFVLIIIFSLLTACGNTTETSSSGSEKQKAETKTFRYGLAGPAADPMGIVSDKIAKEVSEATEGKIKIEVYPGSQLGGEVEMVNQVKAGSIDFALITAGALSNFVPEMAVLDMPFLFNGYEHAQKALGGEVGAELTEKAAEAGFEVLAYMDYGLGQIVNTKKEIRTPEDLKGMKMRTLENDIFMDTFKALGADPVPIPFPELYTSMQQGVVDGTDAVNVVMTGGKLFEVAKFYTEVGLNYRSGILIMNQEKFNSLDEETKSSLVKVIDENTKYYNETIYPDYEIQAKQMMRDNGVEIIEAKDVNREPFVKAVLSVYDKNKDRFGSIVEKIKALE